MLGRIEIAIGSWGTSDNPAGSVTSGIKDRGRESLCILRRNGRWSNSARTLCSAFAAGRGRNNNHLIAYRLLRALPLRLRALNVNTSVILVKTGAVEIRTYRRSADTTAIAVIVTPSLIRVTRG